MLQLIKKKQKKPISLKEHYKRRNNILLKRRCGGFGDILMHRMIFEDAKSQYPNLNFIFTCPYPFIGMAKDHPSAKTVNINEIDDRNYGIVYDDTTVCRVHEAKYGAENQTHRSDIWANSLGLTLTNHNMHLKSKKLNFGNSKPRILLATQSTNDEFGISKSLTTSQIKELVQALQKDYFLFTIHSERQFIYDELQVQQFIQCSCEQWIDLVASADIVISVDTATFHLAGGLKKPLVGIFGFTNGKVYGKYYDFTLVQKHRDNGDWDCGPCFNMSFCSKCKTYPKPCITEIKCEDILQGFYKELKKLQFLENDQKTSENASNPQTS